MSTDEDESAPDQAAESEAKSSSVASKPVMVDSDQRTSAPDDPSELTSTYDQFIEALVEMRRAGGPWDDDWPYSTEYDPHRPDWAPCYSTATRLEEYTSWSDALDDARGRYGEWNRAAVLDILCEAAAATPGPDTELRYVDYRLYRDTAPGTLPPISYPTATFAPWGHLVSAAGLEPRGWVPNNSSTYEEFLQALIALWRRGGETPTTEQYINNRPEWAPSHSTVYDLKVFDSWRDAVADAKTIRFRGEVAATLQQAASDTPGAGDTLNCLEYRRFRQRHDGELPSVREICQTPADWAARLETAALKPIGARRGLPVTYGELIDGIIAVRDRLGDWPTSDEYSAARPSSAPAAPTTEKDLKAFWSWDDAVADAYATRCDRFATSQVSISRSRDAGSE